MDNLNKKQRRKCMLNIKNKNTKPEVAVRKALTKTGIRYRLHVSKLPGKPDIVISRRKTVIFINGCFWHQHNNCKKKAMPKSNMEYWKPKLEKNIKKQEEDIKKLKKEGWKVFIIWECETRNMDYLSKQVARFLI